jgi:NTE family protein
MAGAMTMETGKIIPFEAEAGRTALVISGGGAKGAFAVGAVKSMFERFRSTGWFSIVGGSSAGALIAPFAALLAAPEPIAAEAMDTLEASATDVTTADVLEKHGILSLFSRRDCLNESDPLEAMIGRTLRPEWFHWLQSPEAPDCYVVYTNFRTGRKVTSSPRDPGMTRERFIASMLASASVPVLMEATLIDGDICYDGGVRDLVPFERAIALGAETIVPIFLDPETMEPSDSRLRRMDEVLLRAVTIMMDETGLNDLQLASDVAIATRVKRELLSAFEGDGNAERRLREVFARPEYSALFAEEKRLTHIVNGLRPDRVMTDNPLSFEPEKMHEWMYLGFAKAGRVVPTSPFLEASARVRATA